jgi:hypothetical protein
MIRIYGHKLGEGSITQVTRGLIAAAEADGVLAGFVPVDAFGEDEFPGATAQAAVSYFSPRTGVSAALPMRIGKHKERWLMLAPNSDRIPEEMARWLPDYVTGMLAPSSWAARVLRAFFDLPVEVCPHGVAPAFRPQLAERKIAYDEYDRGFFGVVHLTSTAGERKGTRELLDGWKLALDQGILSDRSSLFIVAPYEGLAEHRFWISERKLDKEKVFLRAEFGVSPAELSRKLSRFHLVMQPSRGEGFGLIPLESRALGVPTAATCVTGHAEHFPSTALEARQRGCVLIEHGPDSPIDDLPGATAPSVSAEAIADALGFAYENWPELAAEALIRAPELGEAWAWPKVAGPVLRQIARAAR